jgi:manganese-transporting P-type ATPase
MDKLAVSERQKKKVYHFNLLRRRHIALRTDTILVSAIFGTLFYIFGTRCFDKEDILASACFILIIAINGVLLLCNFWSVGWNEWVAFSKIADGQIENCTHVKVRIDNKK